jgi:hypothetical protein
MASQPLPLLEHSDWAFEVVPLGPPPPQGFDFLLQGGRPSRIPPQRLPWAIYTPEWTGEVDRATDVWNECGQALGIGRLFWRTIDPQLADLWIDWRDPRLPPDKAAATWWDTGPNYRRVRGISMDPQYNVPDGNRSQVLAHELGHVLGLGESSQPQDMMFFQMHGRRLGLGDVRLSGRDAQALAWLYGQRRFAAIKGRRDR